MTKYEFLDLILRYFLSRGGLSSKMGRLFDLKHKGFKKLTLVVIKLKQLAFWNNTKFLLYKLLILQERSRHKTFLIFEWKAIVNFIRPIRFVQCRWAFALEVY